MPFSANCPACGAAVVFKSSASFHGVCEFCRSTLVRQGGNLENLGRMADLIEDASPIQIGTEGQYHGVHFAVIGRIQLRYAAGVWNEWHLLFDDQRGGWLSDAGGEYLISFLTAPDAPLPGFAALMPNDALKLAGRDFVVTDLEEAMCISGQGELPFAFGAGYPAQLADLRTTDEAAAAFASIDYSETPPLFFVGESLPFAAFKFANLRADQVAAKPAGVVKALQCPSCGGAITLHDKAVQSVACPSCLCVLDADNESLRILQKVAAATRIEPSIPLGSTGRFVDKDWTVIGFQQRVITADSIEYPWQEFLLHHPEEGFRWLVEAEGHWNWVSPVSKPPPYSVGLPAVTWGGDTFQRYTLDGKTFRRYSSGLTVAESDHSKGAWETFRRFSSGSAVTRYVSGEFTWKVSVGETWECIDFIAPPKMLSRESSHNETSWSLGVYLPAEDVAAAFKLKAALPAPIGIGVNQPNPRGESHRRVCGNFWKFLALAVVAQALWFFVLGGRTLLDQRLVFSPQNEEPVVTQTFQLDHDARNLVLRHDTDVDNNWLGLNLTLVEKKSGRAWVAVSDVAYWHGSDDGENWSEGNRSRELVFSDLPAGSYYFVIDPEISTEKPVAVADRIRVIRDQAAWSNFFFLLIVLAVFPLFSRYRMTAFENERWKNADFLLSGADIGSGGSDSDSGGDD
jgi:ribosomal protein S27E